MRLRPGPSRADVVFGRRRVSHATLHLLDHRDPTRRGLAFHPAFGSTFMVNVYSGGQGPLLDGPEAAVTFAADTVSQWVGPT